jgi:hypothetical protein
VLKEGSAMQLRKRNFRYIIAILTISLTIGLTAFYANKVRGDESDPPPPSVPTHDIAGITAGEATKTATDAKEEALMESSEATAVANEQLGIIDKYVYQTPPIPYPVGTIEAVTSALPPNGIGIVQSATSAFINKYHISNMWTGTVNGNLVNVYAGSKADVDGQPGIWNTPEQGVLIYDTLGNGTDGEYLTGTRAGRLTLTASNGTCLTVAAYDADEYTIFTFDAATRLWSCN